MSEVISAYAANIGALIINLANRGFMIRVATEETVFGGNKVYLQVSNLKTNKTIKEALSENEVVAIGDIGVIADAIVEKLRKS